MDYLLVSEKYFVDGMMVGEFCVVVIIMSDNSVVNLLLVIVGGFVGLIVFLC